jgi:hypothetical protein
MSYIKWRNETALKGVQELDEIIEMYEFAEKQYAYTNLHGETTLNEHQNRQNASEMYSY